jgi:hypothetical protein
MSAKVLTNAIIARILRASDRGVPTNMASQCEVARSQKLARTFVTIRKTDC